jgi:hypothetical protein
MQTLEQKARVQHSTIHSVTVYICSTLRTTGAVGEGQSLVWVPTLSYFVVACGGGCSGPWTPTPAACRAASSVGFSGDCAGGALGGAPLTWKVVVLASMDCSRSRSSPCRAACGRVRSSRAPVVSHCHNCFTGTVMLKFAAAQVCRAQSKQVHAEAKPSVCVLM